MTSWMTRATVCECRLKVPGGILVVSSSVIVTVLGVCSECTDWDKFPSMRGLPVMRFVGVALVVSAAGWVVLGLWLETIRQWSANAECSIRQAVAIDD